MIEVASTALARMPASPSAPEEISPANVARLKLVLSFPIDRRTGYAGAPAFLGDTLFLQSPFPHRLDALALSRIGANSRWSWVPAAAGRALGLDCCNVTLGGPVLADGGLYLNGFDGHTAALDPATGRVLWQVKTADPAQGESLVLPPLVAGGRVFVGNQGDDYGARGWIAALDAATGGILWRFYSTGPDNEVGIGPEFKPFYPSGRGPDLGAASWPPQAWQQGGGGLADVPLYDTDLDLLIYGTGHPAPWNPWQRRGDNHWTSGIFARDPASGMARWFTPISPHDPYALGTGGSLIAADLPWSGTVRPLLLHPDADGRVYVLDRRTGEILAADPFTGVNATTTIETRTGEPVRNPAKSVQLNSTTRDICPAWPGATGEAGTALGASAFSTQTGLLYIPVNRLCMDVEARDVTYIPGTPFMGADLRVKASGGESRGAVVAWNLLARRSTWQAEEPFPVMSGVLAMASGLVFYGTLDGWFKAVNARSGRPLWAFKTTSPIVGQPITFRLSDGRQYVAVIGGRGGPAARAADPEIDIRDATAARGYANALHDLPLPADSRGALYLFALP